jgi:hypothetical protein
VEPSARSLDDQVDPGGLVARFHAGKTPLGHHWELLSPTGDLLAVTARVHRGGTVLRAYWKLVQVTGMGVGDDIHVELRGADKCVLARASSINDTPAAVTIADPSGGQVAKSSRAKQTMTVYGGDHGELAELVSEGEGPWPVTGPAGSELGRLYADDPGPSVSQSAVSWAIDAKLALNSAAYAQSQHLGLRRVTLYAYAPGDGAPPLALALLPLLAGLTY